MNHTVFRRRSIVLLRTTLLTLTAVSVLGCTMSSDMYKTWSVQQTYAKLATDSTIVVVDVRTPQEFMSETGHLRNARLIPVQELESRLSELQQFKHRTILVYCRSGNRSGRASEILTKQGFTPVNMAGGMIEWNAANLPVER
jgi:rhodanese-related sulfurtransferase